MDEQEEDEEMFPPPEEPAPKPHGGRPHKPKIPACKMQRLDELATPPKRAFLALWNEHSYHLPKDKVKNLKILLQKLYAMSPEETAQYFAELRAEVKAATMRKQLKQKLRKYLVCKQEEKQKQRAYMLFKKLLKCGMSYAAQNPIPPVVSIRLRYLSDIILEQLCTLRRVEMPDRAKPNKQGQFLIAVSDWMAIAVERLYFSAQTTIQNITTENQAADETMEVPTSPEGFGHPLASSTPQRHSLDRTMNVPNTYSGMGEPDAHSTPIKHSLNQTAPGRYTEMGKPLAASTPEGSTILDLGPPLAQSSPMRLGPPLAQSSPMRLGPPLAQSSPMRLSAQNDTMQVPSTYYDFGQPDAEATRNEMDLYPYYSILIEDEFYKRIILKPETQQAQEESVQKPEPPKTVDARVKSKCQKIYHYARMPPPPHKKPDLSKLEKSASQRLEQFKKKMDPCKTPQKGNKFMQEKPPCKTQLTQPHQNDPCRSYQKQDQLKTIMAPCKTSKRLDQNKPGKSPCKPCQKQGQIKTIKPPCKKCKKQGESKGKKCPGQEPDSDDDSPDQQKLKRTKCQSLREETLKSYY